jgi:hypothetical protein
MTEEPHVNLAVLKLNFEARTVARSVASGRLFASNIDFLCMEAKPLRFHKTEGANNHIKQGDTLIFAHNPIGVTDKRLPAMLTNAIHGCFGGKEHAMLASISKGHESIAFQRDFDFQPRIKSTDSP